MMIANLTMELMLVYLSTALLLLDFLGGLSLPSRYNQISRQADLLHMTLTSSLNSPP